MSDITGQINAKRLGNTGITEEILTRIADAEGGELTVIAQVRYEGVHKKRDGSRKVDLVITDLEATTDGDADEHVRGVQRALFMNRKLHGTDSQPALMDSIDDKEPTVEEVMAKGRQYTPHDFEHDPSVDEDYVCSVCGNVEDHALHVDQDDDLFLEPEGADEDDAA